MISFEVRMHMHTLALQLISQGAPQHLHFSDIVRNSGIDLTYNDNELLISAILIKNEYCIHFLLNEQKVYEYFVKLPYKVLHKLDQAQRSYFNGILLKQAQEGPWNLNILLMKNGHIEYVRELNQQSLANFEPILIQEEHEASPNMINQFSLKRERENDFDKSESRSLKKQKFNFSLHQ